MVLVHAEHLLGAVGLQREAMQASEVVEVGMSGVGIDMSEGWHTWSRKQSSGHVLAEQQVQISRALQQTSFRSRPFAWGTYLLQNDFFERCIRQILNESGRIWTLYARRYRQVRLLYGVESSAQGQRLRACRSPLHNILSP